jgi:hypothetical protein
MRFLHWELDLNSGNVESFAEAGRRAEMTIVN